MPVLAGYMATVIGAVNAAPRMLDVALPGFSGTVLTLLGVSHLGYLAGTVPNPAGPADDSEQAEQPKQPVVAGQRNSSDE